MCTMEVPAYQLVHMWILLVFPQQLSVWLITKLAGFHYSFLTICE